MSHFRTPSEDSAETLTTETRQQRLTRLGVATPRFLQGVYPFAGRGFFDTCPTFDHRVLPHRIED